MWMDSGNGRAIKYGKVKWAAHLPRNFIIWQLLAENNQPAITLHCRISLMRGSWKKSWHRIGAAKHQILIRTSLQGLMAVHRENHVFVIKGFSSVTFHVHQIGKALKTTSPTRRLEHYAEYDTLVGASTSEVIHQIRTYVHLIAVMGNEVCHARPSLSTA